MTDTITLTGIVATDPRDMRTASGLAICSFRFASSQRRYDRARSEWVDGDTNWYTVTAFRHLADNVAASVSKGDHLVVAGRLRIRAWENGERSGTAVEVDAEAIGHDLLWGRAAFTRVPHARASQGAHDLTATHDLTAAQDPTAAQAPPAPDGQGLGLGAPPQPGVVDPLAVPPVVPPAVVPPAAGHPADASQARVSPSLDPATVRPVEPAAVDLAVDPATDPARPLVPDPWAAATVGPDETPF